MSRAMPDAPEILLAAPWPPLRSEIARHVAEVKLPALAEVARVHLLGHLAASAGPAPVFHGLAVQDVGAGLQAHPDAMLLAHIGNGVEQNQAAVRALAARPGFVVLHDLITHHAWFEACQRSHRFGDYVASIQRHYGTDAAFQAQAAQHDGGVVHALAPGIPLFEPFLDNALGVIVHSQMAYDGVVARGRWPVLRLDLPHSVPQNTAALLAHRQTQVSALRAGEPLRLLVFGHLGQNRGLREIIDALAALKALGRHAFTLDIVGAVHGFDDLDAVLQRQGLMGWVHRHGFVTDPALDAALHHAHLAINLRSPTMGEASASQMRMYSAALPGIVVNTGWYAEQPASAVCHVPAPLSVAALVQAITGLAENPQRLLALAAGGLAQLEQRHQPGPYVAQLLQFMAQVAPAGQRLRLARSYLQRASQAAAGLEMQKTAGLGAVIASITAGVGASTGVLAMNNDIKNAMPTTSTVPEVTPESLATLMDADLALQANPTGALEGLEGSRHSAGGRPPDDAGLQALAQRMHPRVALPARLRRGPLQWPRVERGLLKVWNFVSRDWREPVGMVHGMLSRQHARTARLERAVSQLSRQLADLRSVLEDADGEQIAATGRPQALQTKLAHDAFMERLGSYFRGDPEELRRRLQAHLPAVAQAVENAHFPALPDGAPRMLDLGCGRGEWLALMREAGHAAHGVDLLPECVNVCQRLGLSADCGDALQVLKETAPGSLAVVSAFHLIEHIPLSAQIGLVQDAFRALAPGGLLLLETPNAENLEVIGRNFWHDPTHTKPVPAELLRVLALAAGFDAQATETRFLQHPDVPEAERLTYPERLRHLLFCGHDTALYAWKTR